LDILNQHNIKANFYTVGNQIDQHPDIAKAIDSAGIEVGNHSYSHQRLIFKPLSYIASEITKTSKLIRDIGYPG